MSVRTVKDAIEAVGGEAAVRNIIGVSCDALRKWRNKGCIPPKNWPAFVEHGNGLVTYESLEAMWRSAGAAA